MLAPHRHGARSLAILLALPLAGCALWPGAVPAGPAGVPGNTVSASIAPTPAPSAPSGRTTSSTVPASAPTGFATYPTPSEPACARPTDAPASVAGADGPTLTARRVEKAWKESSSGKSLGVTTGVVGRPSGSNNPAAVLEVKGTPRVSLNIMEWSSLGTFVFADPGSAAAKLAAVRAMVHEPCSYQFGMVGPGVVARISRDEPDLVVVTSTMSRGVLTDTFIRYGNTVTYQFMSLAPPPVDEVRDEVLGALRGA